MTHPSLGWVITTAGFAAAGAGLVFGLSLIVVIGAQNAFVLRQGVLRSYIGTVVTICAAADVALIAAGVAGAHAVLADRGWLLNAVRYAGAAFLLGYAGLAARRALRPAALADGTQHATASWAGVVAACLAFTFLNPGVYLDTVVLLGSVANSHPGRQWWFAAGAALASVAWFSALGFGGRALAPLLRRPRAWQVLDGLVALTLVITAVRLLLDGA